METLGYQFGNYRLDLRAKELRRNGEPVALAASAFDCLAYLVEHRERAVGRDELIAAVWGRADVSDNLLAQTIVRLRRALGDGGTEQRYIKTMARVGYRWIAQTTVLLPSLAPKAQAAEFPAVAEAATTRRKPMRTQGVRPSLLIALLVTLGLAASYGLWQFLQPQQARSSLELKQGSAIVLPAVVRAPEEWKWLHLGLMDLIAQQLRRAQLPTENSQDVLNLLKQTDGADRSPWAAFALVVTPQAVWSDNRWHVHLDAKARDGRLWQSESSSGDVLTAARAASDLLLVQLGFNAEPGRLANASQSEYLLRIESAQLAGQPALAQRLIDQAPASQRDRPELAYAQAELYCDEGKLPLCEQALSDLRQRLSPAQQPLLRGKVLASLWFPYARKHQWSEGIAALSEAIRLLQGQKDADALANAYVNRSHLEDYAGQLDEASADLGRARIHFILAGDTVGQARVDRAMGVIAMNRDQYAEALPLLQRAYEQYQRMGMRQLLSSALDPLAHAQAMLLRFPEELATTDRYWPFEQRHLDFLDGYVRHQLSRRRALALADNGRTVEAVSLLQRTQADAGLQEEAGMRAELRMQLAKLALQRGDEEGAAVWIGQALDGMALKDYDERDYAQACYLHAVLLQRTGRVAELKAAVAALKAWVAGRPKPDDWVTIWLLRAQAVQAWGEGQHEQAIEQLKTAMAAADAKGVPEGIVAVGQSYALALLAAGHAEQAAAISGRLSSWSKLDWRAAQVEARVYQALGQAQAAQAAWIKARQLAGDRPWQAGPATVF